MNENKIQMNSKDLCDLMNKFRQMEKKTEKKHFIVMRDIRKELDTLESLGLRGEYGFLESYYIDKQNKKRPMFLLTLKDLEFLKDCSRYDKRMYDYVIKQLNPNYKCEINTILATYTRKELLINQILLAWFDEEQIKMQYPVLDYKLDYYIPECDLIIEYDELSGHKDVKKDNKRMDEILNYMVNEWLNNPMSDGYDVESYIKNNKKPTDVIKVIRIKEFEEYIGLNELFEYLTFDFRSFSRLENLKR